jgi:hypothetical protein
MNPHTLLGKFKNYNLHLWNLMKYGNQILLLRERLTYLTSSPLSKGLTQFHLLPLEGGG